MDESDQRLGTITGKPLQGKVALIIGGSSIDTHYLALFLAKYGADIALIYQQAYPDHIRETKQRIESAGQRCLIFGQNNDENFPKEMLQQVSESLDRLDLFIVYSSQSRAELRPPESSENTPSHGTNHAASLFANIDIITGILEWMVEPAATNVT